MSEAANQIFKKARERVYRAVAVKKAAQPLSAAMSGSRASDAQQGERGRGSVDDATAFLREATQRYDLPATLEASAGCVIPKHPKLHYHYYISIYF